MKKCFIVLGYQAHNNGGIEPDWAIKAFSTYRGALLYMQKLTSIVQKLGMNVDHLADPIKDSKCSYQKLEKAHKLDPKAFPKNGETIVMGDYNINFYSVEVPFIES